MQWSIGLYYLSIGIVGLLASLFLIETIRLRLSSSSNKDEGNGSYQRLKNLLQRLLLWSIKIPLFGLTISVAAICLWTILAGFLVVALVWDTPDITFRHQFDLMTISKRLGHHAAALLPVLFLLSSKNSLIALLLGSSHEKLNIAHRWLGTTIVVLIVLHTICYTMCYMQMDELHQLLERTNIYGEIGGSFFCLILLSALPVIRRKLYEYFYAIHIVATAIVLVMSWLHDEKTIPFVKASVAIIVVDRVVRLLRIWYLSWCTDGARITTISPDLLKLSVKLKHNCLPAQWLPGSHCFISLPQVSRHQFHPFTIASCSYEGVLELYIAKHKGFTTRLHLLKEDTPHFCLIDGPYGSPTLARFQAYPEVLLMAGGTGITFAMPVLKSIIRRNTSDVKVTLLWSVRCPATLNHFKMQIAEYLNVVRLHSTCVVQVSVEIFVTDRLAVDFEAIEFKLPEISEKVLSIPEGQLNEEKNNITITKGRCSVADVLQRSVENAERIAIGYCGPQSFTNDVSDTCEQLLKRSTKDIWLYNEAFGW